MIRYLYIVLFGLVVNSTHAQDTIFQKIYGSSSSDFGRAVVQTYDHNFIMVGTSTTFSSNSNHIWILKVDSFGNYMWQKTFDGINTEWVSEIIETKDSCLIICGYTNSTGNGGYDGYVLKLNKYGDTLWTKTYGGQKWDLIHDVIESYTGEYYFCGETYNTSGLRDVYVIKTKPNGDTLWTKNFGSDSIDVAYAMIETVDSNIVVVGMTMISGNQDIYILKLDTGGNNIWTKVIDWSKDEYAESIVNNGNGEMFLGGATNSFGLGDFDLFIYKINALGDSIRSEAYGGPLEDKGASVVKSKNNKVYVSGYANSYSAGKKDAVYYFADVSLNFQGSRVLGSLENEMIFDSYPCYDGSVVFVGQTSSFGYGLEDYYLIKTDTLGSTTSQFGVIIGIENIDKKRKLKVYPNPSSSLVNINSSDLMIKEVSVLSVSGKIVYSHYFNNKEISIFTNDMESGIYFLYIVFENNQTDITKLIISH